MSVAADLWQAGELIAVMAWETWWALVLGFTLSGVIETFVSDERMSDILGGDGWREVGLGTLFGAASSSCSYAAVGTSRTVFRKGASGVASLGAFLFASTDLVIELGLVIWVLLGWQFVVGEFVGGVIAVITLTLLFKHVVPQRVFDDARDRVRASRTRQCAACGMEIDDDDDEVRTLETVAGTKHFCCGGCLRSYRSRTDADGDVSLTEKLLTPDGWRAACRNALKEWEMLWAEIAVGFLLAGVIAGFVPDVWWTSLFDAGGSLDGVVRNAVLAVAIAIVTSMCSVGNVPFALVLWTNGLPFGAVFSFIYADLIIPPLVNAYRRYYGWRMAAVLFLSFAAAAVVAGVLTDLLLGGLGMVPDRVGAGTFDNGYTTPLNAAFTALFCLEIVLARGAENVERSLRALPAELRRRARAATAAARRLERWTYRTALGFGDVVVHLTRACYSAAAALGRLLAALGRLLRRAADHLR